MEKTVLAEDTKHLHLVLSRSQIANYTCLTIQWIVIRTYPRHSNVLRPMSSSSSWEDHLAITPFIQTTYTQILMVAT